MEQDISFNFGRPLAAAPKQLMPSVFYTGIKDTERRSCSRRTGERYYRNDVAVISILCIYSNAALRLIYFDHVGRLPANDASHIRQFYIIGIIKFVSVLIEPVIGRSLSEDFLPGDRIIEADGKLIENQLDLYSVESSSFPVIIERDGEHIERMIEGRNLPFAWESGIRVSRNSGSPLLYGIQRSFDIAVSAVKALGALLSFHLSDALSVLTGPVKAAENIGGITVLAFSESAGSGIRSLFQLLAAVSVSIAAGNLLPIPTFDGGQVLICLSEVIRGKELTPRSYIVLQIIGMILAVLIMLLMYSLDIKAYLF